MTAHDKSLKDFAHLFDVALALEGAEILPHKIYDEYCSDK